MLIKTRGFAYFVETLVVVVLVQLLKKLLPKLKIDLTGGFDPCVAAPFVFALPVVAIKMLLVDKTGWSGLLTDALGRIPAPGEHPQITLSGIRFTVLEMDERRIGRVKAEVLPEPVAADPEE